MLDDRFEKARETRARNRGDRLTVVANQWERKMELERRDDDQWHLVIAHCGAGGAARETIEVKPDDGFTREDDDLHLCRSAIDDPTWCDTC